jgi:hypothetical protein
MAGEACLGPVTGLVHQKWLHATGTSRPATRQSTAATAKTLAVPKWRRAGDAARSKSKVTWFALAPVRLDPTAALTLSCINKEAESCPSLNQALPPQR